MGRHWIGVALLGGIVAWVAGAPVASAQIAAPPIAPGTFAGENPAVIKWGAPSRFGLGAIGQKVTTDPETQTLDSAGGLVGLRLVGERFALGLEYAQVTDQESDLKDVRSGGTAGLALQTGSSIAWGLGYNTSKQETDLVDQTNTEPTFGISLRLAELWFIGAVVGRETIDQKTRDVTILPLDGERDTFLYGIGFRRGGTVIVHAEIFGGSKDDFDTKTLGKTLGETMSGGTLEFTFWSFLIGGSARHTVVKHAFVDTIDQTMADIGWAPREGLAVTLHYESRVANFKDLGPGAPKSNKLETGAAVFTWQF